MDKQQYAILLNKIVDSEDYGFYIFKPITAVRGKYDEENKIFLDEFGDERLEITNSDLYYSELNDAVGFIKTEDEIMAIYPEAEDIGEAISYYIDKLLQERIEVYFDYDSVSVREIPYDTLILNFDQEFSDEDSSLIDQSEGYEDYDSLIDQIKGYADCDPKEIEVYNSYKKIYNNRDYTVIMINELDEFLDCEDIELIKKKLSSIKNNKFSYAKVIESEGTEKCYFVFDTVIDDLISINNIEEMHGNIEFIRNSKNFSNINFAEDYKSDYGFFMIYQDIKEMRSFIKSKLEFYRDILKNIETKQIEHNDDILLVQEFLNKEIEMLLSFKSTISVSDIKDKYKTFYKKQLSKVDEVSKTIEEFLANKDDDHKEVQTLYDKMFKEKTIEEIVFSIKEQMNALDNLVGLENVKTEIKNFIRLLKFNKKTKDIIKSIPINLNMKFTGNAGTGKTTVANIISKIFYNLEYIKSDRVISCTAADLIAGYVGQTAIKTKELINKYKGGVIFIDEAYVLSAPGQEFGPEAIVEIIKELEQNRTVFIFAGYTKEMKDFIDSNSGIKSRIGINIEFDDYTEEELCQMLDNLFTNAGFILEDGLEGQFYKIFENAKKLPNFGNGRYVKETVFNSIIKEHAKNTEESYDCNVLTTITINDLSSDLINIKNNKNQMGFVYKDPDVKKKLLKNNKNVL